MITLLGRQQKGLNKHTDTQKLRQEDKQVPVTQGTGRLRAVLSLPRAGLCSAASSTGMPAQARFGGHQPLSAMLGSRGQEADQDSEALSQCPAFCTNPKTRAKPTILVWCCFTNNNWKAFLAEILHSAASSKLAFQLTIFLKFRSAKKTTLLYNHTDS